MVVVRAGRVGGVAENLYTPGHRYANERYRRGFDRIFRKGVKVRVHLPDGVEDRVYRGDEYEVIDGRDDITDTDRRTKA